MLRYLVLFVSTLALASQGLRYDTEYPSIEYASTTPTDRVTHLQKKLAAGETELRFDDGTGYLASVLKELEVPIDSQMLVFSKTSFQKGLISSETPRAIYFNDDVYVAWAQRSPALEIATQDPKLGAVFYTLRQAKDEPPMFERQTFLCLRCHDSFSLTGGGVPRHIIGSGMTDASGELVSHEGWYLTNHGTPLEKRWGGWYVTGTHGAQQHLGNVVATAAEVPDFSTTGNVTDLSKLIDEGPYLGEHSDIVALMVAEHQIYVQNWMTRVSWDTRTALARGERDPGAIAEPLVRALLMVDEAPISHEIRGSSGFAEAFVRPGPHDPHGRSLRELDLETRLFRYPLSYLIYSDAFAGLPDVTKTYVYRRLSEVLTRKDDSEAFHHLTKEDRKAVLGILEATQEDFRAWRRSLDADERERH